MKKTITFFIYLLFGLTILFPAVFLLSACLGCCCRFRLASISAFAIVIAVLSIWMVILSLKVRGAVENRVASILAVTFAPLSIINGVFYIVAYTTVPVITCCLISVSCSFFLTLKLPSSSSYKITTAVLTALMILPVSCLTFFLLIFSSIGQTTVIQAIESPDKKHYAQVIDSDQGALGGDTLVNVGKSWKINAIIFQIEKKPQTVYLGPWGEYKDMQVHWKNEHCLVINSVEYEIE